MSELIVEQALQLAILAYQNGLLTGPGLARVVDNWSARPSRDIVDLIIECGQGDSESIRASLILLATRASGGLSTRGALLAATVDLPSAHASDPDETGCISPLTWDSGTPVPSKHREAGAPVTSDLGSSGGIRYTKENVHAKGGLGVVFIARDRELNRKVALKEIQEEQTKRPLAQERFVLEAEITGRLEHPGIVPVYGLGAYPDGRPFYAMRFIQGDSLEASCLAFHRTHERSPDASARAVALRGLLRRFLDVCNALEYAHSRGILHRDIKPANIMVGDYGETLVVDWGLARVMDPAARPTSDLGADPADFQSLIGHAATVEGSIVGTPGFMSPEQASGVVDGLGPASDIYSLGATLYTILTGRGPFPEISPIPAILLRVRSGDFPAPRSIHPEIPRGLDAICLKAMALRPGDRYPTARALADDLERWLADEPVVALPEGRIERLSRWTRQHRQVTVSAAVALLLVATVATSASIVVESARRSESQEKNKAQHALLVARAASARAEAALASESKALAAANESGAQADRNFRKARQTVDDFLTAVSESEDLKLLPDAQAFRRTLLEKARDYYRDFLHGRATDEALRWEVGLATDRLGSVVAEIGSLHDALALHSEAIRLLEPRAVAEPSDDDVQYTLARARANLAALEKQAGHEDRAEASFREGIKILETLTKSQPDQAFYQEALARFLDHLAGILIEGKRAAEGDRLQARSIAIRRRLVQAHPRDNVFREGYAGALNALGNRQAQTGKIDDARRSLTRAVEVAEAMAQDAPRMAQHQARLASFLNDLAGLLQQIGHPKESQQTFARALGLIEVLVRENPKVLTYKQSLAETLNRVGLAQSRTGKGPDAERSYGWAVELGEELVRDNPDATDFQANLAQALGSLGQILRGNGQADEAEHCIARAISAYETLHRRSPDVLKYQDGLASELAHLAELQRRAGRPAEAERSYRKALTIRKALVHASPRVPDYRSSYSDALGGLAGLLAATGRADQAIPLYREAVGNQNQALWTEPKNTKFWKSIDTLLLGQAGALRSVGNGKEAASATRQRTKIWASVNFQEYEAAREFALCLPILRGPDVESIAAEAVRTLRNAVAHGWNDAPRLAHDPAFAPLRPREDFQQILQGLQDRTLPANPFVR